MKNAIFFFIAALFILSCNNDNKEAKSIVQAEETSTEFFPVTSYIKGQINEIKNSGVNPLKITSINGKMDSSWLKQEEIDSSFSEFITPVIDTANMLEFFTESKFLDQTLNSFTFTYEPKKELPATMSLKRWDVYVNPESNRVKRVYIEKTGSGTTELQLSWLAGNNARVVYLSTDTSGTQKITKEVLIKWNFDED
jgi:hypothetical protein